MGQTIKIKDPFVLKSRTILWNKGQNSWLSIEMQKRKPDKMHILLSNIQESRNRNRLPLPNKDDGEISYSYIVFYC